MQRAKIGDVELEYQVEGDGEPLLLIHGAHIADAMAPLAAEPALGGYQRITYHRRGFAGSTKVPGPTSIEAQIADAVGLLDHLGVGDANVVGHSGGGMVALALAAAHPERLRSMALLEPAIPGVPSADLFIDVVRVLTEQYDGGDAAGAVDAFLALVGEDTWRQTIDGTVPGGVEQAEKDAATFFESEMPAFAGWQFGPDDARAYPGPVLSVLGTASSPLFVEGRARLHELFPQCVDADIPNATHLLQMQEPTAVADAIAQFLAHGGSGAESVIPRSRSQHREVVGRQASSKTE